MALLIGCSDDSDQILSETPEVVDAATVSAPTEAPLLAEEATAAPDTPTPTIPPTETAVPTPTATTTPPPPVISEIGPNGEAIYTYPFEGISVSIPSTWRKAELTTAAIDPELERLYTVEGFQNLLDSGIKLYAIDWSDVSQGSASPMNMSLVVLNENEEDEMESQSLDLFAERFVEQVTYSLDMAYEDVSIMPVTLGGGAAIRIDYTRDLTNQLGERLGLNFTHILAVQSGKTYNITLSTPDVLSDTIESTFSDFSQGIQLLPIVEQP